MEPILCADSIPNFLGLLDLTIAPSLLYYAYVPVIIISILTGLFVFLKDRFSLKSSLLFSLTIIFSIFLLNEVLLWTAVPAGLVVFGWALTLLLRSLFLVNIALFVYVYIYGNLPRLTILGLIFTALTPIILALPTELTVRKFNLPYCEGISGYVWYYEYLIEFLAILVFVTWGLMRTIYFFKERSEKNLQAVYLIGGTILFLLFFFVTEVIGEETGYFEITLLGPVGTLIFLITIAYLIVKFNAFNTKLIAAQALVLGLIILVGSQLLFTKSTTNMILISINLVISCFGGYFLVRSVQKEIKQREELEVLTQKLEKANQRLKVLDQLKSEFVSVASHQLRSPLTSVRGYASMLLEGSYGALSDKARDAIERIAESSRMMALSVEDYLNVSRIQAGNMKYILTDFNLGEMASHIVDDIRRDAIKKGLVLSYKSDLKGQGVVHADNGKTMQILHNLINNSIKYTPKGTVTVFAHDQGKKLFIDVIDTGIGMSKETINSIFGKFERAKNANEVNVTGTGLGLYVAQKMAEEMGGNIEAYSDGEGKGSTFRLIMPLQL